jgi:hypothetical protein
VSGGWLILGLGLLFYWDRQGALGRSLAWFLVFWGWSNLSLITLGKTVARLAELVSSRTPAKKRMATRGVFLWASGKIGCLLLVVVLLMQVRELPLSVILLGFGTLVIVPLLGGWVWSRLTPLEEEGDSPAEEDDESE